MESTFLDFFTDPLLRGPTIGSMLMCLGAALIGVIIFIRKQSLLGETLSHATYPGVILGVILSGSLALTEAHELTFSIIVMVGAFLSAILGLFSIAFLRRKLKTSSDSALCFILSAFFGIGLTLASHVQFTNPLLYRQAQAYLFGQAATMTDLHILVYALLSSFIILAIYLMYKEIHAMTFDREYASSLGIPVKRITTLIFCLVVLAVVVGIRSVGVILMSAMLVAPAIAARQLSNKLWCIFIWAALIGMSSAFFGNYLSLWGSQAMIAQVPGLRFSLPTGPMIVLVASAFCVLSLMFAPRRGLFVRTIHIARFKFKCLSENIMKMLWRLSLDRPISFKEIANHQEVPTLYLKFVLNRLCKKGWLNHSSDSSYTLTPEGRARGGNIVRLHRLWEVYLADFLGVGAERVHPSAEEMEHILTPELEKELSLLLGNPKQDPHKQPIPPSEAI